MESDLRVWLPRLCYTGYCSRAAAQPCFCCNVDCAVMWRCFQQKGSKVEDEHCKMVSKIQEVPAGINLSHHAREEHAQEEEGTDESRHGHEHDPSLQQR